MVVVLPQVSLASSENAYEPVPSVTVVKATESPVMVSVVGPFITSAAPVAMTAYGNNGVNVTPGPDSAAIGNTLGSPLRVTIAVSARRFARSTSSSV